MLAQEEHVEAKALKEQGWSISAIARHLGRDRKTIRTSLSPGHAPEGRTRSTDPFARFVPYTTQRLKEDPHLQLSVLLREVRALGFASSYQTLTREVRARSLRPHCEACAGVKGRATIDIPHDPGHETQWDWLELTETPWGETAYVQVGTLAHSGKFRGSFQPAKDTGHLLAAMQEVIWNLGGLTKRFRIDAMEGAVVPGTRRLNAAFADFCRSLAVGVDMCPPRRGNRKGVVEKSNDYLAQSWWRTAEVATPEQAQASLDAFCARIADARPRADATVGALAAAEPLRPVPRSPYPVEVSESRGVSWGALVSFDGNRYSVPPAFVDATVMVHWRVGDPGFEIRSMTGEVLARHRRRPKGAGAAVRLPEHKAALEKAVLAAFTTKPPCRRKVNRPPSEAARALAGELIDAAQRGKPSYTAFAEDLLGVEVASAERRKLAGRLRFAHFPVIKRLEDFDFDAQPGLDRSLVEELATLRFVEEKANVLMVGPPGVGKTMLALILGYRPVVDHDAVLRRAPAPDLRRARLPPSAGGGSLRDLPGGVAAGGGGSHDRDHQPEHRLVGEIFSDSMMAAAILDRFLFRATLLAINGDSYRMRVHRERLQELREGVSATMPR